MDGPPAWVPKGCSHMMVYVAAFLFFLFFVGSLALSLIFKKRSLLSEEEASAILEGMTCASCTCTCPSAGKNRLPGQNKDCDLEKKAAADDSEDLDVEDEGLGEQTIAHKNV